MSIYINSKYNILIFLLLFCPISAFSQIKWNTTIGFGVGYGYNFGKLSGDKYFSGAASKSLFELEMNLMGVYAAMDYGVGKPNDSSYDEAAATLGIKIGPSFKIGKDDYKRWVITPYIGGYNYSTTDDSTNRFIFGTKVSYVFNFLEIGAHLDNREFGINIGIDLVDEAKPSYIPYPTVPYNVPLKERK